VKNKKAQFVMTRKLLFLQYGHKVRMLGQGEDCPESLIINN
jgi:hypothetical protein